MAQLEPDVHELTIKYLYDTSDLVEHVDVMIKHLTAMRDELSALGGVKPYGNAEVHLDWDITRSEWAELVGVLQQHRDVEFVRRLIDAGKLDPCPKARYWSPVREHLIDDDGQFVLCPQPDGLRPVEVGPPVDTDETMRWVLYEDDAAPAELDGERVELTFTRRDVVTVDQRKVIDSGRYGLYPRVGQVVHYWLGATSGCEETTIAAVADDGEPAEARSCIAVQQDGYVAGVIRHDLPGRVIAGLAPPLACWHYPHECDSAS